VKFPNFCIAVEETHGLASRLQRQSGQKPQSGTLLYPHERRATQGERTMKRENVILSAVGLVVALSVPSWAQLQRTLPTQTVTLRVPWRPSTFRNGS
jgi:hypothetical protein